MSNLFFEDVKISFGNHVISSEVRPATQSEIDECKRLYESGLCPHTIIRDEPGWLYDLRICAICGKTDLI